MILPQTHDGLPRKAQGEGMCWGDGQGCPLAVSPCVGTSYCLAGMKGPDPGPCGQYSGGSVHCFEWKWNWGRQAPEVTPGPVGQLASSTASACKAPSRGNQRSARSLPSGGLGHLWNSWGRAPEAQNVCFLFAAHSPPGLVSRPGRGCLPWQDRGQLPRLKGRLVWALGGAGARALGIFQPLLGGG